MVSVVYSSRFTEGVLNFNSLEEAHQKASEMVEEWELPSIECKLNAVSHDGWDYGVMIVSHQEDEDILLSNLMDKILS
jgi:hypothetical protein